MAKKFTEVVSEYLALDPSTPADPIELQAMSDRLVRSKDTFDRFIAASCIAEVTTQYPVGSSERIRSADRVVGVLRIPRNMALGPEVSGVPAARLVADMPLIRHGATLKSLEDVRSNLLQHTAGIVSAIEQPDARKGHRALVGTVAENMVALALNAGKDTDVSAVHSFFRQDNALTLVDNQPYRWDLAVVSEGRSLDPGTYHVQVRSGTAPIHNFHPAVVEVDTNQVYGVSRSTPLKTVAAQLAGPEAAVPRFLLQARERLLGILAEHAPSQPLPPSNT